MANILFININYCKQEAKKEYDRDMNKTEKKISSESIYKGRVINVTKDVVSCPNGSTSLREIVHHRGGVAILFKIDNKFVLERQYRYAINEEIIEIPAGKIEEGEIPLPAAERELLEETGYRPLEMIFLGDMYPTVGYSSEVIHLFYCEKAVKEERHLDNDEVIDLFTLSLEKAEELINENKIKDSKTIAAFYLYKNKILK